jgi:hypothetical protein
LQKKAVLRVTVGSTIARTWPIGSSHVVGDEALGFVVEPLPALRLVDRGRPIQQLVDLGVAVARGVGEALGVEEDVEEPVGVGPLGPPGVGPVGLLLEDPGVGVRRVDGLELHRDVDLRELRLEELRLADPLGRVLDHEAGAEPAGVAGLGELLPGQLQVVPEARKAGSDHQSPGMTGPRAG